MALSRTLTLGGSRMHSHVNIQTWPKLLEDAAAAALGSPVRVVLADDYDQLLKQVLDGALDMAWLPPLLHARAAEEGARLVALPQREGWLTFRSALLVRKFDPITSLSALSGVRAAWRDRNSASGYLFPRLEIIARGSAAEKVFASEKFYGSVVDAAKAVVAREADLCTCFVSDPAARDPERAKEEIARRLGDIAQSLRVLHVTDPIPPDGIVVSSRVNLLERNAISQALLSMHTTPQGKKALTEVMQAEKLAPVNESLLRSLKSWAEAAARRGA